MKDKDVFNIITVTKRNWNAETPTEVDTLLTQDINWKYNKKIFKKFG
jgi:hypothetical protein